MKLFFLCLIVLFVACDSSNNQEAENLAVGEDTVFNKQIQIAKFEKGYPYSDNIHQAMVNPQSVEVLDFEPSYFISADTLKLFTNLTGITLRELGENVTLELFFKSLKPIAEQIKDIYIDYDVKMGDIPKEIEQFVNLEELTIGDTVGKIPAAFFKLKKLKNLDMLTNTKVSDDFKKLSSVEYIRFATTQSTILPAILGEMQGLESIDLHWHIDSLPRSLKKLPKLRRIGTVSSELQKNLDPINNEQFFEQLEALKKYLPDGCRISMTVTG